MDPGWTVNELTEASLELMHRTGLESGYLRPIVYLGYGAMGVAPALDSARVAIAAWAWGSYLGEKADQEGCRLVVSSWQRNGIHSVPRSPRRPAHTSTRRSPRSLRSVPATTTP